MTLMSKKFEEKLAFGSKNDMRNLVNFNMSSGKSENLRFNVLLLLIAYKISAKNCRRVTSLPLKIDPNFEQELAFCLKYDIVW